MDVFINMIVVTMSQSILTSNHHVVHLNIYNFASQLYLHKAEGKNKNQKTKNLGALVFNGHSQGLRARVASFKFLVWLAQKI